MKSFFEILQEILSVTHALHIYGKFPRFSVDEWSDVDCKIELRLAKKNLSELCECLGIPEKICIRAKNILWWDGGPVHLVEEVGIPL